MCFPSKNVAGKIIRDKSMLTYKLSELMSSIDVAKNFGVVLSKLANHEVDKICILRNNKPEAVVLSAFEYKQLCDYHDE